MLCQDLVHILLYHDAEFVALHLLTRLHTLKLNTIITSYTYIQISITFAGNNNYYFTSIWWIICLGTITNINNWLSNVTTNFFLKKKLWFKNFLCTMSLPHLVIVPFNYYKVKYHFFLNNYNIIQYLYFNSFHKIGDQTFPIN